MRLRRLTWVSSPIYGDIVLFWLNVSVYRYEMSASGELTKTKYSQLRSLQSLEYCNVVCSLCFLLEKMRFRSMKMPPFRNVFSTCCRNAIKISSPKLTPQQFGYLAAALMQTCKRERWRSAHHQHPILCPPLMPEKAMENNQHQHLP